ncbi:MAG: GNAT family N-acetyltransferase [Pseudomonadota bacterium]
MPPELPASPVSPVTTWPEPRALQEHEWPALRAAVNEIFRPGQDEGDLTDECPLLFDPSNRDNLRAIVDDGAGATGAAGAQVLAHAGFVIREALVLRRRVRIACIGAVFTRPAWRGRGLGSRVLSDALRRARQGADLVMASGDRGLYRRQGLDSVPPLARFTLPAAGAAPSGLDVRAATKADLQTMATLYDAEDVHFIRPSGDWDRLWDAGRLVDAPGVFSVVLRGGVIVGYIAAQRGGRRANGSLRPRRILEIAGERAAIVDVAASVADELLLPVYDTAAIAACERKGWIRTARQFLITAEALTIDVRVIPWYGLNYI